MSNNASFTPPSLLLSTIGLSLATFMQVLDTTIANVACRLFPATWVSARSRALG